MTAPRPAADHAIAQDVGIVVIGRNEGERLVGCLRSLEPNGAAVVYVDSGSTDGSVAAARSAGAALVELDMARPFTAARARNEGFAALKAHRPDVRFIQFIDGDCELDSSWLATALAFLKQREDVALVCGRRRERHPDVSVYNWLCDLEWNTPIGEALACGGDSLVRADAFAAVGGLNPSLMAGEEPELCLRLRQKGWKIWRLDAEMTRHDAAMMRFGQWWLRAVRSGYGYAEVALLHAATPGGIWRRELARALVWGGLVPLAIVGGAPVQPAVLLAVLVYPLQVLRIAVRRGAAAPRSWAYAVFMTLAKFAEFQGVVKYAWRRWRGAATVPIEYKKVGVPHS